MIIVAVRNNPQRIFFIRFLIFHIVKELVNQYILVDKNCNMLRIYSLIKYRMKIYECFGIKEFGFKKVVEKLLCHRLGVKPEKLIELYHNDLSESDFAWLQESYHSYSRDKKPLEYILGKVSFALLDFKVNEHTLIPRPETEYMIQAVDEYIKTWKPEGKKVLVDVGTGSGVL